jgi:hydrogenase-1 operon protein HyaE
MTAPHPLINRLIDDFGYPHLAGSGLDAFVDAPGDAVLFCSGDPVQYPEALDVAVVLPELLRAFPGRLRAGVVAAEQAASAQARFGFTRWPTLVFLRGGEYVGMLSGIQDWSVYLERVRALLTAAPGRPPSIGIPVATSAPAPNCH